MHSKEFFLQVYKQQLCVYYTILYLIQDRLMTGLSQRACAAKTIIANKLELWQYPLIFYKMQMRSCDMHKGVPTS